MITLTDINFASLAHSVGLSFASPATQSFISKRGETHCFHFNDDGEFPFATIRDAWENPQRYVDANPTCPLSYVVSAFKMRENLLDYVKGQVPLVEIESYGRKAYIPANASDEQKQILLSSL